MLGKKIWGHLISWIVGIEAPSDIISVTLNAVCSVAFDLMSESDE